jgi:tetratricopeptide (TPR) repeat protein
MKIFNIIGQGDEMKRFTAFLLALCMALPLWGCGKDDSAAKWQNQYSLGVKCFDDEEYHEAVVAFTAAIKLDPDRADAYEGRGDAYMKIAASGAAGRDAMYEKAQTDYEQAVSVDGGKARIYSSLANAYEAEGNTDKARDALERGYKATGDKTLLPSAAPTPAPAPSKKPVAVKASQTETMISALSSCDYLALLGQTYDEIASQYGPCTGVDADIEGYQEYRFSQLEPSLDFDYSFRGRTLGSDGSSVYSNKFTGSQVDAKIDHSAKCTAVYWFKLGEVMNVPSGGFVPDEQLCQSSGSLYGELYYFDVGNFEFSLYMNSNGSVTADTYVCIIQS